MRRVLTPLLCLTLLSSAALADPWAWRAYPNGERAIRFDVADAWLLLDAPDALAIERVEAVMPKVVPAGVLARVERLLGDRIAIQVEGVDLLGLRSLSVALVRAGVARRVWPAAQRASGVGFFDDQLILKTGPGFDPGRLDALGITLKRPSNRPGVIGATARDGDGIGAAWAATKVPGVVWAEPDIIRHVVTYDLPDDPQLGEQWHLESDDDVGDIEIEAAWATSRGSRDIVVGIFDTGFDMDHPDLVDNIVGGFDAAGGDDDPEAACSASPDGAGPAPGCPAQAPYRESHGTAVAGIVAAKADNGLHGAGVCPECALFPVRLLGGSGLRSLSNAEAFQRAADAGVAVINNSWGPGLTRFFPLAVAERETFDSITTEARGGKGVVLVFAAGNDYFTPATANPYAAHPGVMTISASTRTDDFACYSNYGSVIAIAGPSRGCFNGESGIATTDYVGQEGYGAGDFTNGFGGTSAASPVVAGLAGLVLSVNPDLTAQQVRLVLQRTADKILADKNPWLQQFGIDLAVEFAYDERGFSTGFGYGRINAANAVALAGAMDDAVAGPCTDACPNCIDDRCAPICATDDDCPAATRCRPGPDGILACQLPKPELTAMGQACTAECEACVITFDSRYDQAEVCTATCETDDDCVFGFDCRTVERGQPQICVPGNAECGSLWGEARCQSEVKVVGGGVEFCSCDCSGDLPGACPDGFLCANVACQRVRGAILCESVPSANQANYNPQCVPDPTFEQGCEVSLTCPGGMFCIDGTCRVDTERRGCDVCGPCLEDSDCGPGSRCVDLARGKRCLVPCEFGGRANQCPGDSVCADVPGPLDEHCVNPDWRVKGFCPAAYRCEVENRCYQDGDCPEGVTCGEDNFCDLPEAPDAALPPPDAAVGEPDAAVSEPDAAAAEPDAAAPDAQADDEQGGKADSGCAATDAPAAWWVCFGLLALPRRRRR